MPPQSPPPESELSKLSTQELLQLSRVLLVKVKDLRVKQAAELMASVQESQTLRQELLEMQLALEQRLLELHELKMASEELRTIISQLETALESLRASLQSLKAENEQLLRVMSSLERERNAWRITSFFAGGVALSLAFAIVFVK